MENKFYKVDMSGGSYVTALYYNPVTHETKSILARDYDYSDCSRDNDDVYFEQIDENARRLYLRHLGVFSVGDFVEVVKGRTLPHGYKNKVVKISDYKDKYGRYIATYLYFNDGNKINAANCKLMEV